MKKIQKLWKEYIRDLLNEEFLKENQGEGGWNEELVYKINEVTILCDKLNEF